MKTLLSKLLFSTLILIISTFFVKAACTASFTKSISGLTVSFTNTSTTTSGWPNMMMYTWDFGDGTFSYTKNPVKTYATAGYKNVQLTINDSFGCITSVIDTFLLVSSAPTCNASFTRVVSGLTVSFTNTSTSSAGLSSVYYSWYFSNGLYSTLANPTTTFLAPGMQVAQLTIYDSTTHCSSSYMDSILVTSPTNACAANFLKSATGNTVVLTNTSTNTNGLSTGLSYYWYFSDGTSSTLKNPTKVFSTNGYKTISLTISDSTTGCFATKVDSINLPSGCIASYTKSISGLTVNFTNTSINGNGTPNGLSYEWHFSHDATTYTTQNLTKTFTSAGYKPVRLRISDSVQGCYATIHDTIYIPSPSFCAANFTKSVSGLFLLFNNTSLNSNGTQSGLSYYWYFSDGTSSTSKNPTKSFSTGGYKTITLTITDTLQGCFSSKTDTVFLVSPSSCIASFDFPMIAPLTIKFISTSNNTNGTPNGLSYNWQFSDGTSATGAFYIKTFSSPGIKWAKLTISDSLTGCFASRTDSFMLSGSCVAGFTYTVNVLSVTFTNTSLNTNGTSSGLSYFWNFSDGTTSSLKDPVKTFASSGIKTAVLTIIDSTQGCYSSTMDTIVLPSTACNASFTKTTSGLTVTFTNTSLNTNGTPAGLNYFWSFSDGTSSTAQHPVKTFATAGLKYVTLSISDSSTGCFALTGDTIWLSPPLPPCQASFSLATDTTTPFHFFLLNTSTILPGTTFLWDFGDSTTSTSMTPTHTYAHFGYYFVCLTIFHPSCTSTFCDTIGMDSTGMLLKQGAFGFHTLDFTTVNTTTGTRETTSIPEYTVYPNPSNGDVFIEYTFQTATIINIDVTDITGKVVMSKEANGLSGKHTERIDLGDLQPAIYFMTIRTPEMQKNYKLIRN